MHWKCSIQYFKRSFLKNKLPMSESLHQFKHELSLAYESFVWLMFKQQGLVHNQDVHSVNILLIHSFVCTLLHTVLCLNTLGLSSHLPSDRESVVHLYSSFNFCWNAHGSTVISAFEGSFFWIFDTSKIRQNSPFTNLLYVERSCSIF